MCVSKVEIFKEIIYISQNKCFNFFVALKYRSTYVALKYITPKGALKNVIMQGITFFSLNTIQIMFYSQAIEKTIDRFELRYVKIC